MNRSRRVRRSINNGGVVIYVINIGRRIFLCIRRVLWEWMVRFSDM